MTHTPRPDLDQALKEALRPNAAPAELRARLMAQAQRAPKTRPWLRPMLLAAAALLIVGTASMVLPKQVLRPSIPLEAAVRSASEEMNQADVDTSFQGQGCDGKACGEWANACAGFKAPLPAGFSDQDLRSGGSCRVAGEAAAHYQLRDGRMVYVFPRPLEGCMFGGRTTLQQGPHIAQAWNENGRGYLLLAKR
jgi:hypothetical protein